MTWFDKLAAASLPLVPRPIVRRLSARYIAGEQRADALNRGAELQQAGYRVTYDQLGESVHDPATVEAAAAEYRALLDALVAGDLERNVSLKPTQMGLDLGEDLCFSVVDGIAQYAAGHDAFLRFEMEDSPTVDATLRVFARLREAHGGRVGCVLQSMLRRTPDDARALVARPEPLNVRLVKGIYVEPEKVAWQDAGEVVESFLETMRILLDGGAFVGVATHDERVIDGLADYLAEHPEAAPRCEVQMLLGVREELRTAVRERGFPVRVYVPYGEAWYPYVMRRLKKNPKLARYAMLGMFGRREKLASV